MRGLSRSTCPTLVALLLTIPIPAVAAAARAIPQGASQTAHPQVRPAGEPARPVAPAPEPKTEGRGAASAVPRQESKDGAASLQEVLSRISAAIAEQNAKAPAEPGADSHAPVARARITTSTPTPAKMKPRVVLKWDPALTSGGVALLWDDQLNPRRAHVGDLGIRLVWPSRHP